MFLIEFVEPSIVNKKANNSYRLVTHKTHKTHKTHIILTLQINILY